MELQQSLALRAALAAARAARATAELEAAEARAKRARKGMWANFKEEAKGDGRGDDVLGIGRVVDAAGPSVGRWRGGWLAGFGWSGLGATVVAPGAAIEDDTGGMATGAAA